MLRREIRELRYVAQEIDNHARNGCPYSLTFYFDNDEPLTKSQREKLEKHLAYRFHEIWANTWLHLESDRIRKLIGEKQIHK